MQCDFHSHLSFLSLEKAQSFIDGSKDKVWIMGGYQPQEWQQQIRLKNKNPQKIKTCFGLHPWFVRNKDFSQEEALSQFKDFFTQADFIGEIGLDYFVRDTDLKKEMQKFIFEEQLKYSQNKPLALHIVQAHQDALLLLNKYRVSGFIHSFSGSPEIAQQYLALNLKLSFGPSLLKSGYKKAKESLAQTPLESILIESDCPSNFKDTRDPNKVFLDVAKKISEIKSIPLERVLTQNKQNYTSFVEFS